jgi:hypothetical protein
VTVLSALLLASCTGGGGDREAPSTTAPVGAPSAQPQPGDETVESALPEGVASATASVRIVEANGVDYSIAVTATLENASVQVAPNPEPDSNAVTCEVALQIEQELTSNLEGRPAPEVGWRLAYAYFTDEQDSDGSNLMPAGDPPEFDAAAGTPIEPEPGFHWVQPFVADAGFNGAPPLVEGANSARYTIPCPGLADDLTASALTEAYQSGHLTYVFESSLLNGMGTGFRAYLALQADGTAFELLPATRSAFPTYGLPNQIFDDAGRSLVVG